MGVGATLVTPVVAPSFMPTNEAMSLGTSSEAWKDLFLPSGAVIDWSAGDVTLTHSNHELTFGANHVN